MLRALISMFIRSVFGFCEIFEFRTPFIRDERVIHDDLESFQCHSDSINCNLCDINKLPSFVKMIGYERPCIPSKSTRNGTVPYIHNLAVHIPTVVVPSYLLSVFGSFALSTNRDKSTDRTTVAFSVQPNRISPHHNPVKILATVAKYSTSGEDILFFPFQE